MARPQKFNDSQIVWATTKVIAQHGPSQTSIARIARQLKAPTGSIYHRFSSRSELLGKAWLAAAEEFQSSFAEQLESQPDDAAAAGLVAVSSIPNWIRSNPEKARLLLLHRADDFLTDQWPTQMKQQAKALRTQMTQAMRRFSRQVFGNTKKDSLRLVSYLLTDVPLAAVKKHIELGEAPPIIVDTIIEQTYRSIIELGLKIS